MKTNKLLNPLSLFFVGLFLGALSRLFDMYYPNLGEIFSQMSVWILLGTLIAIYSPTKKAAIQAPASASLGIPGSLTVPITKPKLPVSALRNISEFPMCGCCGFGFKTRRLICRMSIFATSYTANRRR